jgi:hypothetical protein
MSNQLEIVENNLETFATYYEAEHHDRLLKDKEV